MSRTTIRSTDNNDLILVYCSKSKKGSVQIVHETRCISDFVSNKALDLLLEGRRLAFEHRSTWIDFSSPLVPALDRYTGGMYKVPKFKERILDALKAGIHCLIISGGYGLLRPEEPIHYYKAEISRTARHWRDRVPAVLLDYINQNAIRRVFVGCSQNYAKVVESSTWICTAEKVYWCVPKFPGRQGAMKKVPKLIGEAVVSLIDAEMSVAAHWRDSWY